MVVLFIQISSWIITVIYSLYVYVRILNITNISKKVYVLGFISAIVIACGVAALVNVLPYTRLLLMVFALSLISWVLIKIKFKFIITSVIISIGISYIIFTICVVISTFAIYIILGEYKYFITLVMAAVMQSISIPFLFKIKRFKKGISFLQNDKTNVSGILICCIALLIISAINIEISPYIGLIIICSVILCAIALFIWWKRGITLQYRELVKERNAKDYERVIAEKDLFIKQLLEDNEMMASTIHRDNKLLPSLINAVELYMESSGDIPAGGENLLNEINRLHDVRSHVLTKSSYLKNKKLYEEISTFAGIIEYMKTKALKSGIQFDAIIKNDAMRILGSIIPPLSLCTLLVELIENAITSALTSEEKRILATIRYENGAYELCVHDSGILFDTNTLLSLGIKRTSTGQGSGGSGIGYMTIFQIIKACNASIIIKEIKPGHSIFTKSIDIRFDKKSEYQLISYRAKKVIEEQKILNKKETKIKPLLKALNY